MTARRWPTQGSVRACIRARARLVGAGAHDARSIFIIISFRPSVVPVTDLIYGGSGTLCSVFIAVHGQVLAQWPQMFRILMLFGTCFPIAL
jgi:hypothetical protein